jgi:hypothetical protein
LAGFAVPFFHEVPAMKQPCSHTPVTQKRPAPQGVSFATASCRQAPVSPQASVVQGLPAFVGKPIEVFRVDADGTTPVEHRIADGRVVIRDRVSRVAVYVAAADAGERARIEARRVALVAEEDGLAFDPGRNPADLEVLQQLVKKR